MSTSNETADDFLAIDVSADDYATIAAADQAVPETEKVDARTLQTEEDFLAQKASYSAKLDTGNIYKTLSTFNPPFPPPSPTTASTSPSTPTSAPSPEKQKLDKKQFQVIAAAVSELYFYRDYIRVVQIARWAQDSFVLDTRMSAAVRKWRDRAAGKIEEGGGVKS